MPGQPLDDRAWARMRDELHNLLRGDVWQGTMKWFANYAEACLENDADLCSRLIGESATLPDGVRELVARRFGPAAEALRAGRQANALELLIAPGKTSAIILALANGSIADPTPDDNLKAASAWGLRATWLEAAGRTTDAAAAYFEAGKSVGMLGNEREEESIALLDRATQLDPTHALAHWHLADVWRVRSSLSTPPYVDRPVLEQSLAAWNSGAESRAPDADTSWAYVVRALICEQFTLLDDAKRRSYLWQAVLFLERAILLDDSDAGRWASLGRCHRALGNERASLHATAKARERDPDSTNALEERAAILADTGNFAEARLLIERRIELSPPGQSLWALGVKAYILVHQKEYRVALELIKEVIAAAPDSIWNLDLKATCCWLLGDTAAARQTYEAILRVGAATRLASDDKRTWAFAAYRLGRTDTAIAALNELADNPFVRDDVSRLLGLCHFVKGDTARSEGLILSRITFANARELDDFLSLELADLELTPGGVRPGPTEVATLIRLKTIVTALADAARTPVEDARLAAEEELTLVPRFHEGIGPPDAVAAAAAWAGVARLQLEGGHLRGAATTYLALNRADGLLVEAPLGMQRTVDAIRAAARRLLAGGQLPEAVERFQELVAVESELGRGRTSEAHRELGDALWSAGRDTDAIAQFVQALAQAPAHEGARCAELHGRIGLAQYLTGTSEDARDNYQRALRLYRGAGNADPGFALADTCRPLLRSANDFWTVDAHWRMLAADLGTDQVTRVEFARALHALAGYLDVHYRLSEPLAAETAIPLVTPVALEIGNMLVPLIDPASEESANGKFLDKDIPAMRERIQRSMGLRNLPGIRVRAQPASVAGYALLLDGVPVASGSVRGQAKFLVESPGMPEPELSSRPADEEVDPSSGLAGRWCPIARLKSETEFVLSHVETVLRRHLHSFLGGDELRTLLVDVRKEGTLGPLAFSPPDDSDYLDGLARVLRALLRENVPITDWSAIFGTISGRDLANVDEVVNELRLKLREQLPGNQEGTTCMQVPAEWEGTDRDLMEAGLMGAAPELANQRLVSIRQWLQSQPGPVALVTRSPHLRRVVRRLIDYEFPSVPVLSLDEVTRPERVVPTPETPQRVAEL